MIRMGRYEVDPLSGNISLARRERKPAEAVLTEVKRVRHDLVRAHKVTDDELKHIIDKVLTGTRNPHYIVTPTNYRRLIDLTNYIVREYGY